MLRFDISPVYSNVVRVEAFITFLASLLFLLGIPWLLVVVGIQGFVRGFIDPHRCMVHRVLTGYLEKRGWGGRRENAGAKMFAQRLLFLASVVATVLWFSGSSMYVVPGFVLLVFSFLEFVFSFCVACWAYGLWYRLRGH